MLELLDRCCTTTALVTKIFKLSVNSLSVFIYFSLEVAQNRVSASNALHEFDDLLISLTFLSTLFDFLLVVIDFGA